jgi:membrane associated rhomboid family serine protease
VIPLRDRNPTRTFPFVTVALIGACFAVFLYELSLTASGGDEALNRFFLTWGAVPARISQSVEAGNLLSQATFGLVTSQFLHGGWLHILGNMLYLWIFGNNIEDRLGHLRFLAFYLVGGIIAALTQLWVDPASEQPLVGASGAIAAALGAYLIVFPGARILTFLTLGFFIQLIEVPALIVLGFWFVLQLFSGAVSLGGDNAEGGVAFFAHIGGFVFGMAVGALLRATGPGGTDRSPAPMG